MNPRAPYDARAVANLLLDLARIRDLQLTQVSILKLIYFAHGWYLATYREPLILQEFEAWKYGPVVKVVRDSFRAFESGPITEKAKKLDVYTSLKVEVPSILSTTDFNFIRSIFDFYSTYDAWKLSDLTHEPGSPWDQIWNSDQPVGRLALRIRNEDIQTYFDRLRAPFRLS
jgi:uncharacterized phage-associated protein